MDRSLFDGVLTVAMENAPTAKAVKELANKNPEGWSRYTRNLASLKGFGEITQHNHLVATPSELARVAVTRFGKAGARTLLATAGLPTELVDQVPEIIEND